MIFFKRFICFFLFSIVFLSESYAKEKVYFARRIPLSPPPELMLPLNPTMDVKDITKLYIEATLDKGPYLYNGPWIFSFLSAEGKYERGKLPKDTQGIDVLRMICQKIEDSSILVAVVSSKAFGTLAEIGYAVGKGNIPVYVFPDPSLSKEEIKDLWFVFQMSAMTSHLWKEEHFKYTPSLFSQKITLEEYQDFVKGLKPAFLK